MDEKKKTKTKKKKRKVSPLLTGLLIILFIAVIVFVYIVYFSGPDIDVSALTSGPVQSQIDTDFPTDILDDARVRTLKQFGPDQVEVFERGQIQNPFQPF